MRLPPLPAATAHPRSQAAKPCGHAQGACEHETTHVANALMIVDHSSRPPSAAQISTVSKFDPQGARG